MKIKRFIASLLSITLIGLSMPVFSSIAEISVTANTDEIYGDFQITKFDDHIEISKYTGDASNVTKTDRITLR